METIIVITIAVTTNLTALGFLAWCISKKKGRTQ